MENDGNQRNNFKDKTFDVDVINKRQLGRIILKHCGNEGTVDNEENGSMRRLLQEAIDYLPKEKEEIWKNASFMIYDIVGNTLKITSGNGHHVFFLNHDMKGETAIHKKQNSCCVIC